MRFGKRDISKIFMFFSRAQKRGRLEIFTFFSSIQKRGAVDWTIGKLLNIILLVVLLVLIIYGLTSGGLIPLLKQVEGKFDETLIMLNMKKGIEFEDCYSEDVVNLGGGEKFLSDLEIGGADISLNVCRNRMCNFSGGLERYRSVEGGIQKFDGLWWKPFVYEFKGGLESVKFNWELYSSGVDLLEKVGARDFYDKGFSGQFVLYGDGAGLGDKEVHAVWQNGKWVVRERRELVYSGEDDDLAINAFVELVDDLYDDKVYWKIIEEAIPGEAYLREETHGISIDVLIGDAGGYDEIDSEQDVINLKKEFGLIKSQLMSQVGFSEEELFEFESALIGKVIELEGEEFVIGAEEIEGEYPIITLNGQYGFVYDSSPEFLSNLFGDVKLNDFPVSLVEKNNGDWRERGNKEYYKLYKVNFEEIYEATLVSRFLNLKCR